MVLTRVARKRAAPDVPSQDSEEGGTNIGNDGVASATTNAGNVIASSTNKVIGTVIEVDQYGFMSLKSFSPPKKKARKVRPKPLEKQVKPPIEDLPTEVLERVLSFVANPTTLLALTSTVKVFRKAIINRPDIVIRAAVYRDDASQRDLESFFDDIRKQSIHIPTTLRLLHLVTATRCERGEHCAGYNLETKKSNPNSLPKTFGVSFCHHCRDDSTISMKKGLAHRLLDDQGYFNHELLSVGKDSNNTMVRQPLFEKSTNDPIGPLIPSYKVTQVGKTYFAQRPESMTRQEGMLATEKIFAAWANEAREKGNKKFLENALTSVSIQATQEESIEELVAHQDNSTRVKEMIEVYDEAQRECKAYRKARRDLANARMVSFNREQKKKHRNKSKGGKKVLSNIMSLLPASKMGKHYKQNFAWLFDCEFDAKGYGRFEVRIVDEMLGKIVRAPSTATSSKVLTGIQRLLEKLEVLEASGFLEDWEKNGISFLDSNCPCEKAIEQYCQQFIPSSDLLKRNWSTMQRGFMTMVEKDQLKQALYMAIHQGTTAKWSIDTDLFWIFTSSVAMEYTTPKDEEWDNYLALAKRVYVTKCRHGWWWGLETFKEAFLIKRSRYRKLVERIRIYLALEATTSFLSGKDPPPHRPEQVFSRQDAVDSVWHIPVQIENHLENGRYDQLLSFHSDLFNNPREWNLNPSEHTTLLP